MSFKKASLVAMLAASMSSAPVLAQTAASAPSTTATARAGAEMDSASELRGGFIVPLIAIIAVILGILAAVGGNDTRPTSP